MMTGVIVDTYDRYILKENGISISATVIKIGVDSRDLKRVDGGITVRTKFILYEYSYNDKKYVRKKFLSDNNIYNLDDIIEITINPKKPSISAFGRNQDIKLVNGWIIALFVMGFLFFILLPWYIIATILEKTRIK